MHQVVLAACLTFSLQYWKFNWRRFGDKIFFVSSLISATLLFFMASTGNVWLSYALYITNSSIYHLLIAAASSIIAAELNSSNFGLVFGFNTFIALAFQSILTFIVNDHRNLALPIRTQFYVYSGYFAVIGLVFAPVLIYNSCLAAKNDENTEVDDEEEKKRHRSRQ
jgi:thiamine transporter 2/3